MPEIDNLEQKIDTNKKYGMEIQEIINFSKNEENVKELGKRLTNNINFLNQQNNKIFIDAVYNATINNQEFQKKIEGKIKKNEQLSEFDIFLLYLQSLVDNNCNPKPSISSSGDVYNRYGGYVLLTYIQHYYMNLSYKFNKTNLIEPISTQKKEIGLPNNIDFSTFGEDNTYMPREFDKLDNWAKSNFSSEYKKEKIASRKRNSEKGDKINDYVKYDMLIFSLEKYQAIVEQKHTKIIKGVYGTEENYNKQQKLAIQYFKDLENINSNPEFSNIQTIIDKIESYSKDLEKIKKKYLKKEKEETAQKKYEEYVEDVIKKQKEMGIDDINDSFSQDVNTAQEAMNFFENMNKLILFQNEKEMIKNKYGDIIDRYENFTQEKFDLIKKYGENNLKKYMEKCKKYEERLQNCENENIKKGFDIEKYRKYEKELKRCNLAKYSENIQIFINNLSIESDSFPIPTIKEDYENQKIKQAKTDERRNNLKNTDIKLYQLCNIGARGLNALVSSTRGTGAKLGALITSLWHDDDEKVAIWERVQNGFWNPHFNMSTQQLQSIYENGKINFNWDNGPGIIAESIVNMLVLVAGGGAISNGIVKGTAKAGLVMGTKGINIAGKIGLFTSGFMQQAGPSFQEGLNSGMTGNQALLYTMLSAGIQGGLELISPNEILFGSGSKLAKTYVKEILKTETKESFKAIGKLFLKNVGSEILEENLQEIIQLAAGNLVNKWANEQFNLGEMLKTDTLETDWNPKNFLATVLVTTLTTGIVTGGSFAIQTPGIGNTQNREELISQIQQNSELCGDVLNILDKAILGKLKIPNVSIQDLNNLKKSLTGNVSFNKNNGTNAQNETFTVSNESFRIPDGGFGAPNEIFAETDESFREIVTKNFEKITELNKIENIDEFIRQAFEFIKGEMGIYDEGLSLKIIDKSSVDKGENNQYSMETNQVTISKDWAGHSLKHIEGKGDRAEIFGAIVHELNHYLQNKEIVLSYYKYIAINILDGKEVLYKKDGKELPFTKQMKDFIINCYLKYEDNYQNNEYFEKAKRYKDNYDNYIEPIKDENQVVINYEEYKGQIIEEESFRRGDMVVYEYRKTIQDLKKIEEYSKILGAKFHEEWRQGMVETDGTRTSRVEKTKDQARILQHNGQTEVDISNTPFEDLPNDWKQENLEAAKVAIELVYSKIKTGENITPEMIEEMAEIVHNKRLERNGIEGSFENQRVTYNQLSEEEKAKDRNQVLQAIEIVNEKNTDYFIGKIQKFGNYYSSLLVKEFESFLDNKDQQRKQNLKENGYSDSEIEEFLNKTQLENLLDFQKFILESENATKEDFIKITDKISIEVKKYAQENYPNMSPTILDNMDKIFKWQTILSTSEIRISDDNGSQKKNENGVYIYDKHKFYDEKIKKQAIEELKIFFNETTGKDLIIANDNNIGVFVGAITTIINNPEILNGMDYLMIGHGTGDSQITDSKNPNSWRLKDTTNTDVYNYIENNIPRGKKILCLVCEHPSEVRDIQVDANGQLMEGVGKPVGLTLSSNQPAKILESGKRQIIGHANIDGAGFIQDDYVPVLREKGKSNIVYYNIENNSDYFDGKSHKFDVNENEAKGNTTNNLEGQELTEEQVENIKKIKELGINVYSSNIDAIKDIKLTEEQVENIKKVKELGIFIVSSDINAIKDIKLTEEQEENIKKIKELGIFIDSSDINAIKDIKLTEEQEENIKKIKELGINVYSSDINAIKDIKLTEEQEENIKKIKELGVNVYSSIINAIKDIKLTEEQEENIKKMKELGIFIDSSDIDAKKDIKLTEEQIENIKKIKELGIFIVSSDIDAIKDIKLTEEQIENIKKIKNEFGIFIGSSDIDAIKDIKLTEEQIENIKKIKNEFGIFIGSSDINAIKDIKLTEEQVENIKKIKELGINVYSSIINAIKDIKLTEEQEENIKKIKELGINVYSSIINEIKDIKLTEEQIENIKKIKNEFGIFIGSSDIDEIKDIKLTEEQEENIKKIKELGIELDIYEIEGIINNPEILSVNSEQFYEGYNYTQHEIKAHQNYRNGSIIENIQSYMQNIISENSDVGAMGKMNVTRAERDISAIEIINTIRSNLVTLPTVDRIKILGGINKVVNKFNTVRKYLNFPNGPYKNPKALLCAMRGITDPNMIDKITDDITVMQHGVGMHFFVGDETSYQIIQDKSLKDSGKRSSGFNTRISDISELNSTLSVGNSKNPGVNRYNYDYGTVWHEGQHNRNSYFMVDKNNTPIIRAKDEILAYLRDGSGIFEVEKWYFTIESILTKPESEGGLYQYGLKGDARENHKAQVRELLTYANYLIELTKNTDTGLTRDKVISMLSDTPADGWKDLHANITEAVKLHLERGVSESKIIKLKDRFIAKMQERAGNNRLLTNLVDFWNSIFPKHGIHLESFWRAGTAEKNTVINEIGQAESIDEIKHILNDPQYSHIGRGADNKGGIEISAIIDEVIAGNKSRITFIPPEIRTKIEVLIK